MLKKTTIALVKTVLPLAIGIYLFWLFFSSMSEEHIVSFRKALKETNYLWVSLALILEFISLWSRAVRWNYMLEPMGYKTPWKHRYHAMMIGYLINYTIPRAGEPSRAAMLFRSDGVPFAKSFGTIIAERAVDALMLGLVTCITMLIGYNDLISIFGEIEHQLGGDAADSGGIGVKQIIYAVIGCILLLGAAAFILSKAFREKLLQFTRGIINGVFAIFKTKNPWGFVAHTFIIWMCWVLMFIVPFYALSETSSIPVTGMLIGFIVGTVGISFTNGGIGVYPLLVGLVVSFYLQSDYPTEARGIGNALGMIIWLSNTALMITLGLISLALLPKNYSRHDDTSGESEK